MVHGSWLMAHGSSLMVEASSLIAHGQDKRAAGPPVPGPPPRRVFVNTYYNHVSENIYDYLILNDNCCLYIMACLLA